MLAFVLAIHQRNCKCDVEEQYRRWRRRAEGARAHEACAKGPLNPPCLHNRKKSWSEVERAPTSIRACGRGRKVKPTLSPTPPSSLLPSSFSAGSINSSNRLKHNPQMQPLGCAARDVNQSAVFSHRMVKLLHSHRRLGMRHPAALISSFPRLAARAMGLCR